MLYRTTGPFKVSPNGYDVIDLPIGSEVGAELGEQMAALGLAEPIAAPAPAPRRRRAPAETKAADE